jgi:hypothetical protein
MFLVVRNAFQEQRPQGCFCASNKWLVRVRMRGRSEIEQPAAINAGSMDPKVLVKNKNMAPPSNAPNPPLSTIEASSGVINRN